MNERTGAELSEGVSGEHAGSSPAKRTTFPQENAESGLIDTISTQEQATSEAKGLKFPKRIKHRGKGLAVIYGKSKAYPQYRVAWSINGKRRMKAFDTYGGEDGALDYAERLVKDLAKGSPVTALSPEQATDALAAMQRLEAYRQATGKRVSLLAVVSEWAEASTKLNGRTVGEAADGYLGTVASIKRRDVGEAAKEFLGVQAPLSRSINGKRAQISAKYAYNRELQLKRFSEAFPNTAVCDLGKVHLDSFFASLSEFSAKSRNHYRAAIRQFLDWATRKDYLARQHRLFEADSMSPERANTAEIEFYTPKEFRALLEASEGHTQAMIAIGGLAGLRVSELLRLDWADVWRVSGHIEVSKSKAKTRQRRLVEICPSLSAWLEPFRSLTSGKVCPITAASTDVLWQQQFLGLCDKAGVTRKNNGIRHSFCTFGYALHGENATAQQAGHAPAMLHANYRGLATKDEAQAWFNVAPKREANVIPISTASARA